MYKDVWKKFGWKMLIAVCSVLLLGGVAFAAPRLQAEPELPNVNDLYSKGLLHLKEGTVFTYKIDSDRLAMVSRGETLPEGSSSIGEEKIPNYLDVQVTSDSAIQSIKVTDYFNIDPKSDDCVREAGKATIQLTAKTKEGQEEAGGEALFEPGTSCDFTYDIQKQNVSIKYEVPSYLPMDNMGGGTITKNDIKLYVTQDGSRLEYPLPDDQYDLGAGATFTKPGSNNNVEVTFDNLIWNGGANKISYAVKKNVKLLKLRIKINGGEERDLDYYKEENKITFEDKSKMSVFVYDEENVTEQGFEIDTNVYGKITVQANSGNMLYYGENEWTYNFSATEWNLSLTDKFDKVRYYDESKKDGLGYIFEPDELYDNISGQTIHKGDEYDVSDFKFTTVGATAGEVSFTVKGKGKWVGADQKLYYQVRRDISNATIVPEPSLEDADYTYDGKQHVPALNVYFDGKEDYGLQEGKDYNLSFVNYNKANGQTRDNAINAGTVTVTVEGTAGPNSGGYYGEVVLEPNYVIEQASISEELGYKLNIGRDTPEGSDFLYTGEAIDVSERARITRLVNGKEQYIPNLSKTDYYIVYKDAQGRELQDGAVEEGNYTATYHFRGDYTGELTASFTIYAYDIDKCKIDVQSCPHDVDGKHIYDGKKHEPSLLVQYENEGKVVIVPETMYNVTWNNNINASDKTAGDAGKASATVNIINQTKTKTKTFTIEPKSIDKMTVVPDDGYNYKAESGYSHSYVGKNNFPELPSVRISASNSVLKIGTDYTDIELYTEDGEEATTGTGGNYPKPGQKYTYLIVGKGNYTGTAETKPFVLEKKSIADLTVKCTIANSSNTADNDENYVRRSLVVTDTEYSETLQLGDDYKIAVDASEVATDGSVKVTVAGQNCYEGEREVFYYVGIDIATVTCYDDRKNPAKKENDERFWFRPLLYTGNRDNMYGMEFAKTEREINSNKIYLMNGNKVLTYQKNYDVDWGPEFYDDEGVRKYASVIFKGRGGYYGELEVYFEISRPGLAEKGYEIQIITSGGIQYEGRQIKPEFKVVNKEGEELPDDCYTVEWGENIEAGTKAGSIKVTGKRDFSGEIDGYFDILPRNIDDVICIRITGLNEGGIYKYSDTSTVNGTVWNGVCPVFQVEFNPDGFNRGTEPKILRWGNSSNGDYSVSYKDNQHVWLNGTSTGPQPKIIIQAEGHNFTGTKEVEFQISPIDLETCEVEPDNWRPFFSGKEIEPSVTVYYDNKKVINDDGEAYTVSYDNNVYVSHPGSGVSATVRISANPNGNYIGEKEVAFTIVGNLSPTDEDAKTNSKLEPTPNPVNYPVSDDAVFFSQMLFKEKKDGDVNWSNSIPMQEGRDYVIDNKPSTVGRHTVNVTGVEGSSFTNSTRLGVVVVGDLSSKEYTSYGGSLDLGVITSVASDSAIKCLQDKLGSVVCGGTTLEYNNDYVFDPAEPNMTTPGEHTVYIRPAEDAKEYLKGYGTITYTVKMGFSKNGYEIDGIEEEYEYNHGDPVLSEKELTVTTDSGKPLAPNTDYVIDYDASQLTEVGQGYIVLKGAEKGNYTGTITKYFWINRYNLANHYKKGDITVKYDDTPLYTGKTINVEDLNVVIQTNAGKEIQRDEYRIEVRSDLEGADYVNWTSDTSVTPQFKIVAKENNYTGEIDNGLEFKIQRKPITDEDVIFELLGSADAYVYHESETLLPEPEGTYNGSVLKKARYQTGESYEGLTYDYTYEYQTDVKSAGEKVIRITGVGNFIGSRQLTYTVEKKDIKDDNVVLTLTAEAPYIYNGQPQTPSFELTYDDQKILVYDGAKTITTKLSDPQIKYENEINAGTAVIHIIADPNDPNYTGQKDYTFTIEPLPIDNHISFLWGSERNNLASFKLELPRAKEWTEDGGPYLPKHLESEGDELPADDNSYVRVYYNGGGITDLELFDNRDYTIDRYYVEPDTDDTRIREEYDNQDFINAGKVKVTITGTGNYTGTACYWYYIGTDISAEGASSLQKTTTVFNAQQQWPVEVVSGLDASKYRIVRYRHAVTEENILGEKPVKDKDGGDTKAFIDADTYYIRIEGKPEAGTYSSKPIQLTYTILPRSINRVLIDGYKAEYQYTGSAVCPAGLTVTDPIDEIRYKLTENKDYTISYSNNINAGVASIIIKGQGNYDSGTTATARFTITSSTISSGSSGGNGGGNSAGSSDGSSGQLAGPSSAISADDVRLTMDTSDAMYYTGSAVYPGVYISGMTENIDYTVTFSNNINVGQGIVTIRGINNSSGVITKTFRIIGDLAKCSVAAIPDQAYTGLAVTPGVTVTCGTNTLLQGTDYTLSYANNINIGTASVVITAARDSNYVGSVTVNFSIGNGISSAVVSGYASHYTYTGEPITPAVSVAAGSATLRAGTDYTVEYADNTNAGTATMTITGKGVYSGTQKVTFVIEPKSIASCTTTDVSGKKYTGDAYTPAVTVSDGGKTLTNGVDYTVTYANNTNPGVASIIIRALNDNYTGTKTINFRIGTVAVSNFHAGNIKSTSMTLAWTAQDYASGYQICDANSRVVKNSTKNKVTLTGLTSGKTYKYKVRSFIRRADGTRAYGSFSTVISATTKLKTPAVKAASTGKNKARIRWSKVTGATGYQIYYSKSATKGFKKLKTTKNTVRTLNIKGLSSGQRYFFRVRAYKRVGSKNIYSNYNSLKAITVK